MLALFYARDECYLRTCGCTYIHKQISVRVFHFSGQKKILRVSALLINSRRYNSTRKTYLSSFILSSRVASALRWRRISLFAICKLQSSHSTQLAIVPNQE